MMTTLMVPQLQSPVRALKIPHQMKEQECTNSPRMREQRLRKHNPNLRRQWQKILYSMKE